MDYSKLNAEELTVAQQMLACIDEVLRSSETFRPNVFIPEFASIIQEYSSNDDDERHEIWSELGRTAAFRSYAEAMGGSEMADALQKVVSDMAKMDAKALRDIAEGGLSKVVEK